MTLARRLSLVAVALAAGACGGRGCAASSPVPPIVKGPDGREYHLLDRGPYKAYYDEWGRLRRIEYDSNADGRADQIAYHDAVKSPRLIEVDEDFDGKVDRWEDYDPSGTLLKVGRTRRRGREAPDMWTTPGPDGVAVRIDYDDDIDGRIERTERLRGGLIVGVEVDADRNGRTDRWQEWAEGRLRSEELDIDGDGVSDRRIRYGDKGQVLGLETVRR
jgi:hypothetical protein